MPPKELSEAVMKLLRKIKRTHGAQRPFLKSAGIRKETLEGMLKNGYVRQDKHEAVLRALEMQETTIDQIVAITCADFGVSITDMLNATRKSLAGDCKISCALLLKESNKLSLAKIAVYTGYKDHTGVIGALNRIGDLLETDRELRRRVNDLRSKIFSK